jgi:hypothetical protein
MADIPPEEPPKTIHGRHDKTRRLLYSYPEMVKDTLDFINEPWVNELDFTTLEKMAESHVSARLDLRFQDVVWKVRCRDTEIFICLLIEFQSSIEPYMAFRIFFYMAIFYDDLIRQVADKKKLPDPDVVVTEDKQRIPKLPLAIPIVCYNGSPVWWPSLDLVGMLRTPPGFECLVPQFRYLLVDEHRVPEERLNDENLLAGLIGLERTDSLEGLLATFSKLLKWVRNPGVRRDFGAVVKATLTHLGVAGSEFEQVKTPEEVETMLAENLTAWRDRVREEGQVVGEATMLTRLLQLKFGSLDDAAREHIAAADAETLLRWADRVLTAKCLSDIFEGA